MNLPEFPSRIDQVILTPLIRTSLMALVGAVSVYLFVEWSNSDQRRLAYAMLATYSVAAAVILVEVGLLPGVSEFIFEEILQLNNPGRGAGTGFTGRTDIWRDVLEIWNQAPIFGTGFRTVPIYPHNGYVMLLAELGLVGLFWFLSLMVFAAVRMWRNRRHPAAAIGLAYLTAFLLYNLFESRPINASNSFTIGFYFLTSFAASRATTPTTLP